MKAYLFRKQFLAQGVECDKLSRKCSSFQEAFCNQHDFADQTQIGNNHCTRSEECFQVLWKFSTSGVTRVHGDEDPDRRVERDLLAHEVERLLLLLDCVLNAFHLNRRKIKVCMLQKASLFNNCFFGLFAAYNLLLLLIPGQR
jgi:hypothetical protein